MGFLGKLFELLDLSVSLFILRQLVIFLFIWYCFMPLNLHLNPVVDNEEFGWLHH